MKIYTVTGRTAGFNAGARLKLTSDQAAARAHKLTPVKGTKDVYEATGPIEFKVGEKIGFDGDLPKTMAEVLESTAPKKDKPAAKAEEKPKTLVEKLTDRAGAKGAAKPAADDAADEGAAEAEAAA